ncbi:GSCFA domain-containing protein [uncultured Winogradskyella sp.]|uniref:GSCFA domain-containing protein n=1 Tax=uncultured Winogradskyella sp. TaxID=395353 RepID=UPI00262E9634|nr:GSCFA domain-containing protein [uncultured Winogradskyella sp.]
MKLQTQIPLKPQSHNQIDYNSKVLLLGSCFSENIGSKFEYLKFQSQTNPFGILFHPLAIENLITRAINEDYYSEDELIFHNEQWSCLDAHSKLNSTSRDDLLKRLNKQIDVTNQQIKDSTHIIITLGTAWVYRYLASDRVVANCHKLPQKQFLKELLSVEQITEALEAIIALVRRINSDTSFVFTVSPVRHLKNGFVENTQSKSHLVTTIHNIVEPRKRQYYFPSYEIVMDELRDYRFYNTDMVHPNNVAIDYIWEKFKMVWLTEEAQKISEHVASIQTKKSHRPFNPNSEAHQQFLEKLQIETDALCARFPHFKFE